MSLKIHTVYSRAVLINSTAYIELKTMLGGVYSIDKGDEFMIKLANGEVITLYNTEYTITCDGCGAVGFAGSLAPGTHTSYKISESDIRQILDSSIDKIRIYTTQGYQEDVISEKRSRKFQKSLKLIYNKLQSIE